MRCSCPAIRKQVARATYQGGAVRSGGTGAMREIKKCAYRRTCGATGTHAELPAGYQPLVVQPCGCPLLRSDEPKSSVSNRPRPVTFASPSARSPRRNLMVPPSATLCVRAKNRLRGPNIAPLPLALRRASRPSTKTACAGLCLANPRSARAPAADRCPHRRSTYHETKRNRFEPEQGRLPFGRCRRATGREHVAAIGAVPSTEGSRMQAFPTSPPPGRPDLRSEEFAGVQRRG